MKKIPLRPLCLCGENFFRRSNCLYKEFLIRRLYGNTTGLKALQTRKLQSLYRRQIPPQQIITLELAHYLAALSQELNRQIGLLVDRRGAVSHVIVGSDHSLLIPDLSDYRGGKGRLRGLRLVHTHFKEEPLNEEDKMDLALLRLDLITVIALDREGQARRLHSAHLLPENAGGRDWQVLDPEQLGQSRVDAEGLVRSLEEEWGRKVPARQVRRGGERAILVSVTSQPRSAAQESLEELRELGVSAGLEVLETVIQSRRDLNPKFLLSRDRLTSLSIRALQLGAGLLVFDQELNPSQVRSITEFSDLKVIDRSQLILDIFAQRARTREGKIQVEMAQLKYILPRLVVRDDSLSRLTGGIGGRGPGETRLEIDRRRVREKIHRLQRDLEAVRAQRQQRRVKRERRGLPVVSIIGYTNAGKSTLLNTLTGSRVAAEDRYFATLDPTSRRLRLPQEREVIITDTVGFIKNLPRDLLAAFRATLEELEGADLLLHVVDIGHPRFEEHMETVSRFLQDLELSRLPVLLVFNKADLVARTFADQVVRRFEAVAVSALDPHSLDPLLDRMEKALGRQLEQRRIDPETPGLGESTREA